MTVDELRADLLARWKAAFGRRTEVEAAATGAVQTVYTQVPGFALTGTFTGWSNGKPKPGVRVSRQPSKDGGDYVFGLDADGRPVHVRYTHPASGSTWQGVYRYGPDEVELCVADGFVAFAIDWEIEGHELAKILKQCGALPKKIAQWRKNGWL